MRDSPTRALESDAEAARERLAQLLDELREHVISERFVGQAVRIAIGVALGALLTSATRGLCGPPRTSPAVDGRAECFADEADDAESTVRQTYDTVYQRIADMPMGGGSGVLPDALRRGFDTGRRRAPSGPGLMAPPYGK